MSDANRSLEKRDLFILCDGPIELVRVNQEMGFNKLHFNGVIEYGDDYHTMSELYEHRMALNVALFNVLLQTYRVFGNVEVMKSRLHNDGTMFKDYFIVFAQTPHGQISYHYDLRHWDLFQIPEVERIPFEYDGHTSKDVIERLLKL